MRLIDADELIVNDDYCQEITCRICKNNISNCEELRYLINNAPTVDAVEVVRCKDCKYHEQPETEKGEHYCCWFDSGVEENGFCSYGERVELANNSTKLDNENDELSCSEEPNRSDTIYRQEAIDALRSMQTYKLGAGDDMLLIDQAEAQTELMMLPSAQTEIVRCKNCKNWDTTWNDGWAKNYHYCPIIDGTRNGDWYCADAERKTDE